MWTWPVDPSCGVSFEDMGLWAQVGFVNLAQKTQLGLVDWAYDPRLGFGTGCG